MRRKNTTLSTATTMRRNRTWSWRINIMLVREGGREGGREGEEGGAGLGTGSLQMVY